MANKKRILLVDDDNDLRGLVLELLESRGFVVSEASDGESALTALRSAEYDLILLDITLPDISGLKILEFVRENHLTCKVIMATGTSGHDLAIKSGTLGAQDYIYKPYSANHLLQSVEYVLST